MTKTSLKDMNLLHDFLFHAIAGHPEYGKPFCKYLLETILARPLRNVTVNTQAAIPGGSPELHGIRLDAYVEEKADNVTDSILYDIETERGESKKASLPRRARYYHVLRDSGLLDTDADYRTLKDAYVIFITPFDPLRSGRMVYTIKNRCVEDPSIPYEDGAVTIFLYTHGKRPETVSDELAALLHYLEDTRPENAVSNELKHIQKIVEHIKNDRDMEIAAMKFQELLNDEREEGWTDGFEKGQVNGFEKGQADGFEKGQADGFKKGREEEQRNTEREKRRADLAEDKIRKAEEKIRRLEAQIASLQIQ